MGVQKPPKVRSRKSHQHKDTPRQAAERAALVPVLPSRLPRRTPDCEDPTASTEAQDARGTEQADAEHMLQSAEEKLADKKKAAWERRAAWYREVRALRRVPEFQVKFTEAIREEFLGALEQFGAVLVACDWVGLSQATVYRHRKIDPTLVEEMDDALERYRQNLVAEVRRRAVEGWNEPVFQQGELVGVKRVFSDRLLEVMVKAKVPEFRDKVDVTSTNVNVDVPAAAEAVGKLTQLSRQQRDALRVVLGDKPGVEPDGAEVVVVDPAPGRVDDLPNPTEE